MKTILLAILIFSICNVQAEDKKGSGEKFQEAKSKMLGNIEKRISNLQSIKSCVSSASDRDALKACRAKLKEHRAEMKEQRKQWKEKRKERKQRRKNRKESYCEHEQNGPHQKHWPKQHTKRHLVESEMVFPPQAFFL